MEGEPEVAVPGPLGRRPSGGRERDDVDEVTDELHGVAGDRPPGPVDAGLFAGGAGLGARARLAGGARAGLQRGKAMVAIRSRPALRLLGADGFRRARSTLAGGWHDIGSVAARVLAPIRRASADACAAVGSVRHRARAQVQALRAALRPRR